MFLVNFSIRNIINIWWEYKWELKYILKHLLFQVRLRWISRCRHHSYTIEHNLYTNTKTLNCHRIVCTIDSFKHWKPCHNFISVRRNAETPLLWNVAYNPFQLLFCRLFERIMCSMQTTGREFIFVFLSLHQRRDVWPSFPCCAQYVFVVSHSNWPK